MAHLPRIAILSTGGTIVSSGATPTQMTGYSISSFSVDDLLASVPALNAVARISAHPVSNIDSMSMTSSIWMKLADAIQSLSENPDISGFVITHGTDTMDETAYFLHLTLKTDKPVVITGAMRPSSAISADGPLNLLNAVRVAADPAARAMGVLICLNDRILCARDAVKTDPCNAQTFESRDWGVLGLIAGEHIRFLRAPLARHTTHSEFAVPQHFPRVDIITGHADDDGSLIQAAVAADARGIVYQGFGNGSIHAGAEDALMQAARAGIAVVRSSRVWGGMVVEGLSKWQDAGFVPAGTLPAQKARVLLQIALANGMNTSEELLRVFSEY